MLAIHIKVLLFLITYHSKASAYVLIRKLQYYAIRYIFYVTLLYIKVCKIFIIIIFN